MNENILSEKVPQSEKMANKDQLGELSDKEEELSDETEEEESQEISKDKCSEAEDNKILNKDKMKNGFIRRNIIFIIGLFLWLICIFCYFYNSKSEVVVHTEILPFSIHYKHWGPSEPLDYLVENVPPLHKPLDDYVHNVNIKEEISPDILILVKSNVRRYDRRQAIRNSWGSEYFKNGRIVRTLFFMGRKDWHSDPDIEREYIRHNDIVQGNFIENYYHLWEKTLMTVSWAYHNGPNTSYFLFVDEDYYLSLKNLIRFTENPTSYPHFDVANPKKFLYAGYIFKDPVVFREGDPEMFDKWKISIQDYPYSNYPNFIAGGVSFISQLCLRLLYIACLHTKHLKFDDVFIGMSAHKANLTLTHSEEFYFYGNPESDEAYKTAIASHGYGEPKVLIKAWRKQVALGNA